MSTLGNAFSGLRVGDSSGPATPQVDVYPDRLEPLEAVFSIPYERDPDFVDHGGLLDRLYELSSRPASMTVLVGPRGIGKTYLTIEHVYRIRQTSPDTWIFWINANTKDRFELSHKNISKHLNLPGCQDSRCNIYHLVRNWFENDEERKWILVLDGLDKEEFLFQDLPGTRRPLVTFLPKSERGAIIVTTTRRSVAGGLVREGSVLEVSSLKGGDGVAILRKKIGSEDVDETGMKELVDALDGMPLAIALAGTYISQRAPRYAVQRYLEEFLKIQQSRLSAPDGEAGRVNRREFEARDSIMVTWEMSFDYIRSVRPSAADLLRLMSFFDRLGIQDYLLGGHAQSDDESTPLHNTDEAGPEPSAGASSEGDAASINTDKSGKFEDDILMLQNYSLISTHPHGKTIEMHRQVQLALHQWLKSNSMYETWKEQFITRLYRHFPSDFPSINLRKEDCQSLFPHVRMALNQVPQSEEGRLQRADLLYRAAYYAGQVEKPYDMEIMASESGRERALLLSENDKDTLHSDLMLVKAFEISGQWDKAAILGEAQLKACLNTLGEEDDITIMSMVNLGNIFYQTSWFEDAQSMHSRALDICKRLQLEDGPRGIGARCGLGLSLAKQGQFEEAEVLLTQVVSTLKGILGEESNEAICNMHNLAMIYEWQSKFEDAETVYVQALAASRKIFGGMHSSTPFIMGGLAAIYSKMGRHSDAEALRLESVEFQRKKLGNNHPDTLKSKDQLSKIYHHQGRYSDAHLHADILDVQEITLGEEHPETLKTMTNLALTYSLQGRHSDAELLHHEVVQLRKRVLGDEHPDTIASMNSLSIVLIDLGDYAAAELLQTQALDIRARLLGEKHTDTLESMHNLALAYLDQGRGQDAEELFSQLLDLQKEVLGDKHLDTIGTMSNLAFAWMGIGRKTEAVELMGKCVDLQMQVLGDDHPDTMKSRESLLSWRSKNISLDT
ncbi:uncharacterized protein N7496_010449 [Penicillium cataractarum]|uniref:NB-ARC domain-containing protein n=1 Tax=Penicillium cataractarum TaxID=2100454 RepID=A0A9W9V3D8_9EURO|nr:uncharacterized protein N7496_010449 [Penicillium cataractarum]KAJ5364736.1 hypothetical protein N7496_010449 [Penicillium cataractarum]